MLLVIENVLSIDLVNRFLKTWETADWQPGYITAGSQAAQVKKNLQLNDHDPLAQEMREEILKSLSNNADFLSAAIPQKIYPPKFNCYQNGGHYGTHVDNAVMTIPGGEYLRTDLSATVFLCAPEDYDGGELVIESEFGAQEVKLEAGDMVLYPSTSLHQVKPVTRGARLASFFWIQSLVADNQDRALLFDLDQSIQKLRSLKQNDEIEAEVSQLTGIYHNLVRRWAQT